MPQFADRETEGDLIEGEWRQLESNHIRSMGNAGAHRATREAYAMRDTLSSYFMAAGEVPWQYEYIRRGTTSRCTLKFTIVSFSVYLYVYND